MEAQPSTRQTTCSTATAAVPEVLKILRDFARKEIEKVAARGLFATSVRTESPALALSLAEMLSKDDGYDVFVIPDMSVVQIKWN